MDIYLWVIFRFLCGVECVCWKMVTGLLCFSFSNSLMCKVRFLLEIFSVLSITFITINLKLVLLLQIYHPIVSGCYSFIFISRYILISLWVLLWLTGCSRVCCLISMYLWVFPVILISSFISFSCSSEKTVGMSS